jgi:hypothetical protein
MEPKKQSCMLYKSSEHGGAFVAPMHPRLCTPFGRSVIDFGAIQREDTWLGACIRVRLLSGHSVRR